MPCMVCIKKVSFRFKFHVDITHYLLSGFPKLTRFLAHHDKILTKLMPKVKKHFDKHGLDTILYSLKWFFVCFIERVSVCETISRFV